MRYVILAVFYLLFSLSCRSQDTLSFHSIRQSVINRQPRPGKRLTQQIDSFSNNYIYAHKTNELYSCSSTNTRSGIYFDFLYLDNKIKWCYYSEPINPNKPRGKKISYRFFLDNDKFYSPKKYNLTDSAYSMFLKKGYSLYELGKSYYQKKIELDRVH